MTRGHAESITATRSSPAARFAPRYRDAVALQARASPRLAQLADTFPLLLIALATGYGPLSTRRAVTRLVVEGRKLAEVANLMGLPLCFRRIPAKVQCGDWPFVRWAPDASCWLAPHVPTQAAAAGPWLGGISLAARYCDEVVACWLARHHCLFTFEAAQCADLLPLTLFAWHSRYGQHYGQPPPPAPWDPTLSLATALARTGLWLRTLRRPVIRNTAPPAAWIAEGRYRDLEFRALLTPAALKEEAQAMQNCVHTYCDAVEDLECQLYSVRSRGQRVATAEIRRRCNGPGLALVQLKGPGNDACALDLLQKVMAWVDEGQHSGVRMPFVPARRLGERRLRELVEAHRQAKGLSDDPVLATLSFSALAIGHQRLSFRVRFDRAA